MRWYDEDSRGLDGAALLASFGMREAYPMAQGPTSPPTVARSVGTAEAEIRFASLLDRVAEQGEEVQVERDGEPAAVLISVDSYEELQRLRRRDRRQRELDLEQLRRLSERIGDRNSDLTEEQIEELADRFSRDMIDDLVAEGKLRFERDVR